VAPWGGTKAPGDREDGTRSALHVMYVARKEVVYHKTRTPRGRDQREDGVNEINRKKKTENKRRWAQLV
jgi:hypothetical protein